MSRGRRSIPQSRKQRGVVELMSVIHDTEVRLKLKQQLRGLVDRIDVDLVKKHMLFSILGRGRG